MNGRTDFALRAFALVLAVVSATAGWDFCLIR
jgi:hypothetical protein